MNLLQLINFLLYTRCDLDPRGDYQDNYAERLRNGKTFDFIVVGGGTSGSIVASRLSENGRYTVLLIEAGGYPTVTTEVPAFWSTTFGTEIDWDYEIEPSPNHSRAYNNFRSKLPRAKVLGGCSSFNGMLYLRSFAADYNHWASMGNEGWDWDTILGYYKKAESAIGKTSDNYGTDGPLTINREDIKDPMYDAILKAAEEAGVEFLSEEGETGIFESFRTVRNGTRCSTAKAYLANVNWWNLKIALNTQVTKVLISNGIAVGVEVVVNNNGKRIKLYASKEVILSAGAINTPQLLMLSGVGPEEHLNKLGIPVKVNLPVGRRLLDHYVIKGLFVKLNPTQNQNSCPSDAALQYCLEREGPMVNFGTSALQWSFSTSEQEIPDMKIYFMYAQRNNGGAVKTYMKGFGLNNQTIASFDELISKNDVFSLSLATSTPKSIGYIELRSKNPFDKPLVYANYLSDENGEDLKSLISSVQVLKNFLNTPTMMSFNAEIANIYIPGCEGFDFDTEPYYECLMKHLGSTGCHISGTCKMGPSDDDEAVVDPSLRVYGVDGLRVVDASVMPQITNRNTMAPCIVIGERGAHFILDDWEWQW